MARKTRSVSFGCDDDRYMQGLRIVAAKKGQNVGQIVFEAVDKCIGPEVREAMDIFFASDAPRMEQCSEADKSKETA